MVAINKNSQKQISAISP